MSNNRKPPDGMGQPDQNAHSHDGCKDVVKPVPQVGHEDEIWKLVAIAFPEKQELDDAVSFIHDQVEQYINRTYPGGNIDARTRLVHAIAKVFREDIRSGRFQNAGIDQLGRRVQGEIEKAEELRRIASIDIHASFNNLCSVINWKIVEWIILERIRDVGGNNHDVDDIKQEIKIVLDFKWCERGFDNADAANAFAKQVAANQAINLFRKIKRRAEVSLDQPANGDPDAPFNPDSPDTGPGPDVGIVRKDDCAMLRAAIQDMKGKPERGGTGVTHRGIIEYLMEHISDIPKPSLRTCGKHFGIPYNTYSRWQASAFQELKDILSRKDLKGYGNE